VTGTSFEDYSTRYAPYFVMTRRDGIIEMRMHRSGGPYSQTMASHNSWGRAWAEVGADPGNEVVILTGTGDRWVDGRGEGDPEYFRKQLNHDARKLLENIVFSIDVPLIAAVNGPGAHTEIALACDITICTPDTEFYDPHFLLARAPGDGQGLAFQGTLGTKRAALALLTSGKLDAAEALRLGLVSEVVPREQLGERAWQLAEMLVRRPPGTRRATRAIVIRPWRQRLVADFGLHLYSQSHGSRVDAGAPGSAPDLAEVQAYGL
jgi:enoyl-CoA hydratase/carnithine racemase